MFNEIDSLDAAVFSGDGLHDEKNRKLLKQHCESWLREIKVFEACDTAIAPTTDHGDHLKSPTH